jgi:hypothetical protein
MAKSIPSLGELELRVLRLVWREQPGTKRRGTELVRADRPVARTFVLKTMQRLEEKLRLWTTRARTAARSICQPPVGAAPPTGAEPTVRCVNDYFPVRTAGVPPRSSGYLIPN